MRILGASDAAHQAKPTPAFLDDEVSDHLDGLKRTLHQATKYEDNPVLLAEHRCEDADIFLYGSVLYEDGDFKMWYDGVARNGYRKACYATSSDGLHWEKRLDLGSGSTS